MTVKTFNNFSLAFASDFKRLFRVGDFVHKVDGMYGIAIYDKRNETISLYRDRIGIKPVYYFDDGTNFGFVSELKGILNMCSTILFEHDNTAVYNFLNYSYIPEPKTCYKMCTSCCLAIV